MTLVVYVLALSIGAVATALALVVVPRLLTSRRFRRTNYRGRPVFATAGIVLITPLVVGCVTAMLAGRGIRIAAAILCGGVALGTLGFIDDVFGSRHAGGLIGHARALLHGELTTGMLKAVGGAVTGLVAAYAIGWRGAWIVAAGAVVALGANLSNLFDVRPGRTIKVWTIAIAALLVAGVRGGGALPVDTMIAGVVVFAVPELGEQLMLGDAGSNLLGGVLGIAAIASLGRAALVAVLAVLAVLTLISEKVSFTRVIEATPPLRWFDHLGRVSSGP